MPAIRTPDLPMRRARVRMQVRALWWLAACALLTLAQALGLLHHYAHGSAPAPAPHATAHAHPHAHTHTDLPALFAGHEDDGPQCKLYDQLLHAEALPSLPPVLAAAPDDLEPLPPAGRVHHAAQTVGYLPRGPPAV